MDDREGALAKLVVFAHGGVLLDRFVAESSCHVQCNIRYPLSKSHSLCLNGSSHRPPAGGFEDEGLEDLPPVNHF